MGQDNFLRNALKGMWGMVKKTNNKENRKAGLNWYKIKRLKHLPYNEKHTHHFLGYTIHFNNGPEILHSLQEIFVEDIYISNFETHQPYIIDCGSNIGLSVLYFKHFYPDAHIVAFEPDSANFKNLQKNLQQVQKNVELRNEAIWVEDTTLSFISEGTLGSRIGESNDQHRINVKATRLRNLLNRRVDFLKMDIEGAEYEVIKDCGEGLEFVQNLFIEYHGSFSQNHELTEILSIVGKYGFHYYIKEATEVFKTPFSRSKDKAMIYDVQLNIFCFRVQ